MKRQFLLAIAAIFIVLTAVFYALHVYDAAYQLVALETGNIIMMALTLSSWVLLSQQPDNAHAAIRGVYSASFLRLMVCLIAILAYAYISRKNNMVHRPTVFLLAGTYAVYTVAEKWLLWRTTRK